MSIKTAIEWAGLNQTIKIEEYHLSNHAMQVVTANPSDGVVLLHSMYEDGDLEGSEEAEEMAQSMRAIVDCVMVRTGDYISARTADWDKPDTDTYDALYCTYVIRRDVWDAHKDELTRIDKAWRSSRQAMADGLIPYKPEV